MAAYRLLAAEMYDLGWEYPMHLGVTEAGEGEDGRMKSAIGIGSLLQDGLGDTIRVSLTGAQFTCFTSANSRWHRARCSRMGSGDSVRVAV